MLARIGYGTRYSVFLGMLAVFIGAVIAIPLGAIAGYAGGKADSIIMRCIDTFATIPTMMLAILVVTVLGNSLFVLAVALSIGSIPGLARITRSSVMMVRNNEYIEAARAIGAPTSTIIIKHIMPNCFSPILVNITLRVGITITATAGLSYVGLGVPLPLPEWGALLTSSKSYLLDAPHMLIYPGVALIITVMMINLVGDGVRSALDPKLKR
jgi:peptide/nickel transport system permease protein